MSTQKLTGQVSGSSVKKFFYAVGRGKNTGIYNSWVECKAQVDKYPNAAFKKFICRYDAENFVNFWKKCTLPVFKVKEITNPADKLIKDKNFKTPFYFDKDNYIKVYTDGSARKNHQKAGVGVWFGENHPLNLSKPVKGISTCNLAEIKAASSAIQVATKAGVKRLKILTDSGYLLNSVTKWIYKWNKNGWKSSVGKPIKHQEEFKDLLRQTHQIKVRWEKVVAHAGIKGNESAHRLARNGFLVTKKVKPQENNTHFLKNADIQATNNKANNKG